MSLVKEEKTQEEVGRAYSTRARSRTVARKKTCTDSLYVWGSKKEKKETRGIKDKRDWNEGEKKGKSPLYSGTTSHLNWGKWKRKDP